MTSFSWRRRRRCGADNPVVVAHVMTSGRTTHFLRDHFAFLAQSCGSDIESHVFANWDGVESEFPHIVRHQFSLGRGFFDRSDLAAAVRLWRDLRKVRPDLCVLSTPKAALFGSLVAASSVPRARRIFLIRGFRFTTMTGVKRRMLALLELFPALLAGTVLCTSKESADLARSVLPNWSASRVRVVVNGSANGIDTRNLFSPELLHPESRSRVRASVGVKDDAPLLLFVGRLCVDKGLDELVSAFREVKSKNPSIELLVVGRDDPSDPLSEATSRELSALCRRLEFVNPEDLPAIYEAADLLVFPSRREGFGMVAAESAAMGTPVLASRVGGLESAVGEGESGLFFSPGDAAELAAAIDRVLHDGSLQRLARTCRSYAVERFDRSLYDAFWLNEYERAVT